MSTSNNHCITSITNSTTQSSDQPQRYNSNKRLKLNNNNNNNNVLYDDRNKNSPDSIIQLIHKHRVTDPKPQIQRKPAEDGNNMPYAQQRLIEHIDTCTPIQHKQQDNTSLWNKLHDDIVKHILKYLTAPELINILLVCAQLRQLVFDYNISHYAVQDSSMTSQALN